MTQTDSNKANRYYPRFITQSKANKGTVILRDGSTAFIRPVEPEDAALLIAFKDNLSEESLRRRFQGIVTTEAFLKAMMLDNTTRENAGENAREHTGGNAGENTGENAALIVLSGNPEQPSIIAHGEYILEKAATAEVAFLVKDEYHGKGLGTLLLERLAMIASRHGIQHFFAETEYKNHKMVDVFRSSGFTTNQKGQHNYLELDFSITSSQQTTEKFELREKLATVASLRPFFTPENVAIIGASSKPSSVGYQITEKLKAYQGQVYPINPKATEIANTKAYPDIASIVTTVDLAVIAVPYGAVLDVVRQCGEKGVKALVVISEGFAEVGAEGLARQLKLRDIAIGYGMRIIGPNCLGIMNTDPTVQLNAGFAPQLTQAGSIAMSSQSGALGLSILDYANKTGLGLSHFVSLGNKADVSSNDLMQYWEEDPKTKLIVLYLESFGNPRRFARLARRIGKKKPILAVKAGRSSVGSKAASSHTAALAANETAVDALFTQTGVIRADKLEDLFDIAKLLSTQPLIQDKRVAIMSNAAGPAIMATDAMIAEGLLLPELSSDLQAALATSLADTASLSNPIDMIASATAEQYAETCKKLLYSPEIDAIHIIYISVGLENSNRIRRLLSEVILEARQHGIQKTIISSFMGLDERYDTIKAGEETIPNYVFPESAAKALGKSYGYASWRSEAVGHFVSHDDIDSNTIIKAKSLLSSSPKGWLSNDTSMQIVKLFGINALETHFAKNKDTALTIANSLGYPIALKMSSRTLVHKSDWDGVKLNLESASEVQDACLEIERCLEQANKGSALDGFVIQPMVKEGLELIMGVSHDPLFGPLIGLGLGGIYTEVLKDIVFRITPLSEKDATDMIESIKAYKLLKGYRGEEPYDIKAIKDMLLRLSRMVEELPMIQELDFNPVTVFPEGKGCIAIDIRIRIT